MMEGMRQFRQSNPKLQRLRLIYICQQPPTMLSFTRDENSTRKLDAQLGLESAISCNCRDSATTNYRSTQSIDELKNCCLNTIETRSSDLDENYARKLVLRIRELRQKEVEMEQTFQMCAQKLAKEIEEKQRMNRLMRKQISLVRSDLEETSRDIAQIRNYMSKQNGCSAQENYGRPQKSEIRPLRRNRSGKLFKRPS